MPTSFCFPSKFSARRALLRASIAGLCALALPLHAQTIRPGGNARGTTRGTTGGATTGRGNFGGNNGGGFSSSSGPRQYRSNTLLGDAMIQIDPETRSLVIVTDDETHRELMKVIQDLDRPKPQVLIKVVFLEVTYNNTSDIGVEGSYTFNLKNPVAATTGSTTTTTNVVRGSDSSTTGNTNTSTTTTNSSLVTPLGTAASVGDSLGLQSLFGLASQSTGSFVRLASDDWSATVRLLQQRGKVEVLSRPSIMARNNQEAVIVVGQEVPFVTNSRITDNGQTINTIQYDNVGIILRVTPFITSNNTVEMIVAPEISTLTDQTVAISNTVSSPVIAKRSAETVVVTPNGTTAVIGGLMETQRTSAVQKIPILGDIPVLGFPFRRTVKSDVKKELLIFLTPYIVSNGEGVETLREDEVDRTELVRKAFTEAEFQKFFEGPDIQKAAAATEITTTTVEKEVRTPEVRKAVSVKSVPADPPSKPAKKKSGR